LTVRGHCRIEVAMAHEEPKAEARKLSGVLIRDLGLRIAGTPLEGVIADFQKELDAAGLRRAKPHFYLSTEWGVPFDTVSIAIPFYLARTDLTDLHRNRHGHVEGSSPAEILRYLRHEMGHVINYAYQLYEEEEWTRMFGRITEPYEEEYRPVPFSRRFITHLPGWYAQKHPDEDWAETFAVWMTPGRDWRAEYAERTEALAKLEYCDRTMTLLRDRDPLVTTTELDEDVGDLAYSLEHFYGEGGSVELPTAVDEALRTALEAGGAGQCRPVAGLLNRLEGELMEQIYRWTGHFPEHTRALLRALADRAKQLGLTYAADRETAVAVRLAILVSTLALNQVHRGAYLP
jgi:hypothetical protein